MHKSLAALGLGEHTDEAIAAYRADYTSRGWAMNALFDGIAELLADLRTAGVRLAVATSRRSHRPADPRPFRRYRALRVIAGANLDGARSAKTDVLAHALAQLHPLPETVVMVGDRSHMTSKARPSTASPPWWPGGATARPTSSTTTPPSHTWRRSTNSAGCSVSTLGRLTLGRLTSAA